MKAPLPSSITRCKSRIFPLILVLFVIASCGKSSRNTMVDISAAPDFTLKTLSNESISLSDLKGKVVLINFWATWCGPCRREIPHLKNLYKTFDRKDFEILSLSDEGAAKIRPFVEKYKLPYHVLLANRGTMMDYNLRAYPTAYLIDKKGIIQFKWEGLRAEQTFERAIKQLIEG